MDLMHLNWLTPLQNYCPRGRAGRPRKVNAAVQTWIKQMHGEGHTIIAISKILHLNKDTVSHYLHSEKRGG